MAATQDQDTLNILFRALMEPLNEIKASQKETITNITLLKESLEGKIAEIDKKNSKRYQILKNNIEDKFDASGKVIQNILLHQEKVIKQLGFHESSEQISNVINIMNDSFKQCMEIMVDLQNDSQKNKEHTCEWKESMEEFRSILRHNTTEMEKVVAESRRVVNSQADITQKMSNVALKGDNHEHRASQRHDRATKDNELVQMRNENVDPMPHRDSFVTYNERKHYGSIEPTATFKIDFDKERKNEDNLFSPVKTTNIFNQETKPNQRTTLSSPIKLSTARVNVKGKKNIANKYDSMFDGIISLMSTGNIYSIIVENSKSPSQYFTSKLTDIRKSDLGIVTHKEEKKLIKISGESFKANIHEVPEKLAFVFDSQDICKQFVDKCLSFY
uniref:PH domain-containing protein n=1 Tax=Rhabditophanes sp. KR3021 TaxID=114890 RepID=A0AC35UG95_9BILA